MTGSTVIRESARTEKKFSKSLKRRCWAGRFPSGEWRSAHGLTAVPPPAAGCVFRYSSRRRFTSSNRSARNYGAAELGPDAFGKLPPFGDGLGVGMNHVEPELLHEWESRPLRLCEFRRAARHRRRGRTPASAFAPARGILSQTSFDRSGLRPPVARMKCPACSSRRRTIGC